MLLWVFGGIGLCILIALAVAGKLLPADTTPPRPVLEEQGFGKLPAAINNASNAAMAVLGRPEAISARYGTLDAVAPSWTAAAPAVNPSVAMGFGVQGGSGTATAVMIAPGEPGRPVPMPPEEEYLPPKVEYTWTGSTLPSLPAAMEVFRMNPRGLSAAARTVMGTLGLNATLAGQVRSINFASSNDPALVFAYDSGSDAMSWYREEAWNGQEQTTASPSDTEAMNAATRFADALGINRSTLKAPHVVRFNDPCTGVPCAMNTTPPGVSGGSAGSDGAAERVAPDMPVSSVAPVAIDAKMMIYPWPGQDLTIQWDAALSGLPILDWNGQPMGALTMQISAGKNLVRSGQYRPFSSMQSSRYPTQSIEAITQSALKGGNNPWGGYGDMPVLTPAQERRRPTVKISLETATLGYSERYDYANGTPQVYYLPVVVFSGQSTDQYGNVSPYSVMVSTLDPAVFDEPDAVPQPIPLMMQGQTEPAVAPPPMPVPEPAPAR